jgi:hypothetical protein
MEIEATAALLRLHQSRALETALFRLRYWRGDAPSFMAL